MKQRAQKLGDSAGLPLDEIRSIMSQLISATWYLHSQNVCHRDLKPDNVMIRV